MTAQVDAGGRLDLRQLSFFDKRSQVLHAQRMSSLLARQTREQLEREWDERKRKPGQKVIKALFTEWMIGKNLGHGAFASVYEASTILPGCGREVKAVLKSSKISPNSSDADPNDENRHQFLYIIRELTTLVHLSRSHPSFPGTDAACHRKYGHPTIVKIYDGIFDDREREFHTFMERANGIELFDYLRSKGGKMPEREVKIVMKQLLLALDYMHANLVLHRDIKLDNIIIDPKTLRIELIDFNLSTFYHPAVPLHEPVGCINYSSPQILTAALRPDEGGYLAERGWSDLWASGVVMYGMLVGFFPFRSQTPRKLYNEIARLEKRPLEWVDADHVPAAARRFVEKMLSPRLAGVLTAGELLEDPYLAGVESPVDDGWREASLSGLLDCLADAEADPAFRPPDRVPAELRRFWTYSPHGVAPEMTSEDLDTQFFSCRRAMFEMLGVEPPSCVVEQERRIAAEVEDVDMDGLDESGGKPWAHPPENPAVGPGMPPRDSGGKEASNGTLGAAAPAAHRASSAGSDATAVPAGEDAVMRAESTNTAGARASGDAERERERTREMERAGARLSHKSKASIAKMVRNGFARVREAVHDWKRCGGRGMVGVSGEAAVMEG